MTGFSVAEAARGSAVGPARVDSHLTVLSAISAGGRGVTRLGYSTLERTAHLVFSEHMRALGLTVYTDPAGNTIAEFLPNDSGREATAARAIGTGSHLDSVPEGGCFDGIAGVVAAMEVASVAVASGASRRRPWRFVAFAAEEGARFGQACNGSRMVAGLTVAEDLDSFHDSEGISMAQAMAEVGLSPMLVGSAVWQPEDWFAFVELHIEQGGVLESTATELGVVDVISGSSRLLVEVTGLASHTGGTPMNLRRDALVTAAECVLACDRMAKDPEHYGTRVTVGRLDVYPGSMTTIPGRVLFTVDVRDVDSDRQRHTVDALIARFTRIASERGTVLTTDIIGDTPPVALPDWVAAHIVEALDSAGFNYRVIPSGASHDSQQINHVVPTGMIFVPSKDGLSHVPEEFTSTDQLARGATALLATLRRLDQTS